MDQQIFGITRVMSSCMKVGQAAGTAAALAYQHKILPSEVDVAELRAPLKKGGAIVELSGLGGPNEVE